MTDSLVNGKIAIPLALVVTLLVAILSATGTYYTREIADSVADANIAARLAVIEDTLAEQKRFAKATEADRFRNTDGEAMRRELMARIAEQERRIASHEVKSAHGIVNERLTRIEVLLDLRSRVDSIK